MVTWLLPALAAALILARILLAVTFAPGRDELAVWYWAWHGIDASYSLVTVGLVRLSTALLGDGALAMRLPTLAAGIASVGLVVVAARRLGAGRNAAWGAAIALAASPWHVHVSAAVHPDAWFCLFTLVFAVTIADSRGAPLFVVIASSLAALAKLPGAWLLPLGAWMIRRRSVRRARHIAATGLVVPAVLLARDLDPRLLAGIREFGRFADDVPPWERLAWIVGEVVVYAGPALLVLSIAGVLALRERSGRQAWPAWSLAALLFVFFLVFFLDGQAKGNWFLPSMVLVMPLGAAALDGARHGRVLRRAVVAGALMTIALALVAHRPDAALDRLRSAARIDETYSRHAGDRESNVSTTRTWSERIASYHRPPTADPRVARALASEAAALVSDDYGVAFGQAWAMGREVRVLLPWDPVFARSCGASPKAGEDVVFVSAARAEPPAAWRLCFKECRPLEADIAEGAATALKPPLHVVLCTGWMGPATLAETSVANPSGDSR